MQSDSTSVTHGSVMEELVRRHDWASTPLGAREAWPQSLRTTIDLMLASGHAMCVIWGPERTFIYNDAYAPILGIRHPQALGSPTRTIWADVWDEVGPLIDRTYAGETQTFAAMPLVMTRHGYKEETWWDFSYSPVRDEQGAVAGLLNITSDASARVIAERERVTANARLRDSEARLRALVGASADVVYSMSADWLEMKQLQGRDFLADTDAPSVRWLDEYILPEDQALVRAAVDRAIATKSTFELEHRIRAADGSVGWTFSRAIPLLDGAGEIVEWFGMAADVTARHAAVAALEESEAFTRGILASSTDCIKVLDLDGRLTFMSEGGQQVMEVSDFNAIAGCPWPGFWQGAGNAEAVAAIADAREGRTRSFVGQADTMAGSPRWWHVAVSPIPGADGRPARILSVSRDITDLRASEEDRDRFRRLAENSTDFVAMADLDGTVFYINDAGRRMVGLEDTDRPFSIPSFFPPEEAEKNENEVLPAVARDGHWVGEMAFRHFRTGELIPVFHSVFSIPDASGKAAGYGTVTIDFRDRKRAENAVRDSEERLRLVVEGAIDHAIITTDPAGVITSWSAGAAEIFGWPADEAVGEPIDIIFTSEERAAGWARRELDEARAAGCSTDARWHATKDGRRVYMNGSVHPLPRDSRGRERGFIKIARDDTARQKTGERQVALLKLGDEFRDIAMPEEIARVACEILGRALDVQLVGYGDVDPVANTVTLTWDWASGDTSALADTLELHDFGEYGEDLQHDQPVIVTDSRDDPRMRDYRAMPEPPNARAFVITPISEHGRLVALLYVGTGEARQWDEAELGFIREVATRIRAAAARAAAEQQQRRTTEELRLLNQSLEARVAERTADRNALWQLSSDIMLRCTFNGTITAVNPAWTTLLGWREDELVGANIFEFIHPDDLAHTTEGAEQSSQGVGFARFDNRYRHRDGSYRWISWSTQPAEGLINAVGRDFTDEREKSAALAQAEEIVRQAQKMEAVGQLTGGVAHDFNNLLTIIRSSVDLLKRPDLKPDRRDRYLQAVSDTVDRAARLTGQLLAFARRQALKPEVFDVGARLRNVAEMIDTVTGVRIDVGVDVPEAACLVRADISQFETALVNMAINARDAMGGEGRVTLRLEGGVTLPPIRGHGGSDASFVAVSVIDTGSGIEPDQLANIFEPFFTTKEVGKGTGLGLSQVFGFVKQSGGDVDVRSSVGEGSTFTIYLPQIIGEATNDACKDEQSVLPTGAGERVLVVEDNVEVGRFCAQILEDLGYAPEMAATAEEALAKLGDDGNGFEVVFSDVVMPGMGGLALGEALRQRLPQLPVVLTSGYSHVLASQSDHGFELLHKPYSTEQLARVLRKVAHTARR